MRKPANECAKPDRPGGWRYLESRVFAGVFPCGISYADRTRQVAGDYAPLAFLSFQTLELVFEKDCPNELRREIEADAAPIQARRGGLYQISTSGQTVRLGGEV